MRKSRLLHAGVGVRASGVGPVEGVEGKQVGAVGGQCREVHRGGVVGEHGHSGDVISWPEHRRRLAGASLGDVSIATRTDRCRAANPLLISVNYQEVHIDQDPSQTVGGLSRKDLITRAGAVAAGAGMLGMLSSTAARAASCTDTVQTIIDTAAIAEGLAVTTYYHGIRSRAVFDHLSDQKPYLKGACLRSIST